MGAGLSYRERFALTLAHKGVDRPPMDLGSTDMTGMEGGPRRLGPLLGLPSHAEDDEADEAVLQALDIDIRGVGGILVPESGLARQISPAEATDAWGIGYAWNGHHYEAVGRPLAGATLEDLDAYPWPKASQIDPATIDAMAAKAKHLYEDTPYVVCGRHPVFGVMELGCWMCGFDDFLYRMAGEPEFVCRFFDIFSAYQRDVIGIYYGAIGPYMHFTTSGDDFGTQRSPFTSPAMFDRLVAPYLKERIRLTKSSTDAAFFHHTCGTVRPLLPSLMDAGVDILNPIQPGAAGMEPELLKRDFGARLTFYGGVDTQELLPNGTPEEVADATRALVGILASEGGYVLSAAHTIQADVPLGNVVAMYRAVGEVA